MTSWFVEESDYQQTSGIEFDLMRSGYLNIQSTDPNASDAVSVPFLWWSPRYTYYSYFSYFWWWDGNQLATGGNVEEKLNNLRFVKFELDEDPDEFYYLVVPQLDKNPFIALDGTYLELDSYDPSYEDGLFGEVLNSNYEFLGVEDAELDAADLLDWVELNNQEQTTAAIDVLPSQLADAESVPEPSAVSGVLLLGAVFLAGVLKRSFSNLRQRIIR